MRRFIFQRLLMMIPTIFVVMTVSFFLMRSAEGGPFDRDRPLPPDVKKNLEAKYGLDKPLLEQYRRYLVMTLHGDLGECTSMPDRTVGEVVAQGFPISLQLAAFALVLAMFFGLVA